MLKISSQIEKFESRSDNTWKLIIGTQEMDSKDVAELAMLKGKQGWFVFSDTGITETDIPTETVDFATDKTPAQRQRAILYRIWEQSATATRGEFETFYRNKVNAINEKLKEKL